MTTTMDRVPDWLLERLVAGELPEGQARDLRARLAARGEEDRLTELQSSNADILAANPPVVVAAEVRRRFAQSQGVPEHQRRGRRGRRGRIVWLLPAIAAGAAALALLTVHEPTKTGGETVAQNDQQGPETTTIKGDPSLQLFRKTPMGQEQLGNETRVRPGDNLQIRYVPKGAAYGVVASVDANGVVTLHLPETPGPSAQLSKTKDDQVLPHAFELDNSPGFERFVFVTSEHPFTTDTVVTALRTGVPLPKNFKVWDITLKKDTP